MADITVLAQGTEEGVPYFVRQGPFCLCAYVGIDPQHPLAEIPYEEMDEHVSVHGGFTFREAGKDGTAWPAGLVWFGWDYGHFMDFIPGNPVGMGSVWTVNQVTKEAKEAAREMSEVLAQHPPISEGEPSVS